MISPVWPTCRLAYSLADVHAAKKLLDQWRAANPEAAAYMKGTTMKPKCEWVFSAEPDYARICRELADQGAKVGRVTINGRMPQTLFHDSITRPIGKFISATAVNGAPGWCRASGDHVADLIPKHPPVKVEGFAAPAKATEAAPPAAPLTAWVQHTGLSAGLCEYILGEPLNPVARDHVPTSGNAYLDRDGKVYFRSGLDRKLVGRFVPVGRFVLGTAGFVPAPKKFGIFIRDGFQSTDYPAKYERRELAETDLAKIPPAKAMQIGYHIREI